MIFASYGVEFGALFPTRPTALNSEFVGGSWPCSTRHGHVLGYCGFMLFPLTSTAVKELATSVPIMGKTLDFEFSYFFAPLDPEKH